MTPRRPLPRSILKWAAIVIAVLIALLLLATWAVNREPIQGKVRQAVAERTGDLVQFKRLDVYLLPRPHVMLRDVAVAVPGKVKGSVKSASVYPEILPLVFGTVHMARASLDSPDLSVDVTPEPGAPPHSEEPKAVFTETRAELEAALRNVRAIAPHFEGRVDNGRVTVYEKGKPVYAVEEIDITAALAEKGFDLEMTAVAPRWRRVAVQGSLLVGRHSIALREATISGGRSSFSNLSVRFGWRTGPFLRISSGQGTLALADIFERKDDLGMQDLLRDVSGLSGLVTFQSMSFRGRLLDRSKWRMETAGEVSRLALESPLLPGPVSVATGSFRTDKDGFSFSNVHASFMDSSIRTSGALAADFTKVALAHFSVSGHVGRSAVRWAVKKFSIPPHLVVRAPLSLADFRVIWKRSGTIAVSGKATIRNGPVLVLDMQKSGGEVLVNRLVIEDESRASLSFRYRAKSVDARFQGSLNDRTIARVFEDPLMDRGWIRGDFRVRVMFDKPEETTTQGVLEAGGLMLPLARITVAVKHVKLEGKNKKIVLNSGSFVWANTPFELNGTLEASSRGILSELDATAETVDVNAILAALAARKEEGRPPVGLAPVPFQGTVRFKVNTLRYGRFTFSPARGNVTKVAEHVRITFNDAAACGISLLGHIEPFDRDGDVGFHAYAVAGAMEPSLRCVSGTDDRVTGLFSFIGDIDGRGSGDRLLRSFKGKAQLYAEKGKIFRYPILARVFAFLNVTELLRGKVPDLGRDGFAYDTMKITGNIVNGRFVIGEAIIEGSTLNIVGEGRIDFVAGTTDLTLLVAPFKTFEYILSKIPILRYILANRLIAIPVRVVGDIHDPEVIPLDPLAIGGNLINIMKRTLTLPFKIIHPLVKALEPGK